MKKSSSHIIRSFFVLYVLLFPFLKASEEGYLDLLDVETSIQPLLPKGESIKNLTMLTEGFSNNLWKVNTDKKTYIFRTPKNSLPEEDYLHIVEVSKLTFNWGISPELIGENTLKQQMLFEYIENAPWPLYEENPEPYQATMKVLKCFHENFKVFTPKEATVYWPFTFIFEESRKLDLSLLPVHFSIALERINSIFEELQPWVKENMTMCHGDFHQKNVLLSKHENLLPKIIDFDSMLPGDPLFDVVKFSIGLPQSLRLELYSEYLERRILKQKEQRHFELIDQTLLMVIAINRFRLTQEAQVSSQEFFSVMEMEEILNSKELLPLFIEIPFDESSSKAKQLAAIYALAEFLRQSAH